MVRSRLVTVGIVALTLSAGLVAPAAADPEGPEPEGCGSVPSHSRIEGDLVVPEGALCVLDHVAITGSVIVRPGASAGLGSSEVKGDAIVHADASLTLSRATLRGHATLDAAASFGVYSATVLGGISGTAAHIDASYARVEGGIDADLLPVQFATVDAHDLVVTGPLSVDGGRIWLRRTTVDGSATLRDPTEVQVCGTTVTGNLKVWRAHGTVGIGRALDNPYWCEIESIDPVVFVHVGGNLYLLDNLHSILVSKTTVTGALACYGNVGPRGIDTRAVDYGSDEGQCEDGYGG